MKKLFRASIIVLILLQTTAWADNYSSRSGYQGSRGATSGDLTFRSTLLASGRAAASSVLFSSSTDVGQGTLAYSVIYKSIGNNATPEVTKLEDGLPGQMVAIIIVAMGPAGSWTLQPDSDTAALNWTGITFNAVGQTATLMYMDETIGWIVMSSSVAVTTASKAQ